MKPIELQVGVSYTLPNGTKFVVKERGTPTSFCMLISGADTILSEKLNDETSFSPYVLLIKLISSSMVPLQGNLACFNIGDVAQQYGVSDRRVYDALRILMMNDIVRKEKIGHYRIDPHIVWNGYTATRYKAVQEWQHG
jgi:hypothetical protein